LKRHLVLFPTMSVRHNVIYLFFGLRREIPLT